MSKDNAPAGVSEGPVAPSPRAGSWSLVCLIAICVGVELLLQLADRGLFLSSNLRRLVYEYGAFWPGLTGDWTPNYTGQPWLMFITYGLLHGGVAHLVVNMITLWSLGRVVLDRVGTLSFLLVYLGAQVWGGIAFALLAEPVPPMVGASGALFGLAGAVLAWNYVDRYTYREGLWPVAQAAGGLVVLNLILWWAMAGQLAWETHLGGFIGGWVMAILVDPRARQATLSDTQAPD